MMPHIHPQWLRHDIHDLSGWVMLASILANLLPREKLFARWPKVREAYSITVDLIALVALNWRAELPSLEREFLGFRSRSRAWFALRKSRRELRKLRERQDGKAC